GKFPDAYAVDTKEGIAVMGPNRVSLAQIQADSSRAFSSGIGVKKMVTYADKLKERKETLVTLQVYDSQQKTAVPFTLVFFNRGTDRIIFTDTVRSGRINFIYSHGAELGVAVSSPGYFPQSVRLNPTMAPVATHYYHDMFLKPSVVRDPSNPNRMVVQSADLDFQNVLFDFNSDVPRKISFVEISAMKQAFSNIDSVALVIEGHTDDIGSEAFNMDLGRRRASAVAKELRSALRPTASLTAISLGEARPVAENDNDFHRSLNRRVTLRVEGARPVPPAVVQSPEPTEEAVEVEVSNIPASIDSVESPGSIDSAKIAQDEEVVPAEPVMSSPLMPQLAKSQARELTKAAKGAERAAKETAKAKAEADKELAKAAKSAAEVALKQRQDSIKAFEDARLRRIMDVAAQRKAADEAKAAEQKAAAAKAKEDAKKGKKSDAPKTTPDKPKK
ncbi:MAG: OmpA family protein, partial [Schleiferiaceae bacterium]